MFRRSRRIACTAGIVLSAMGSSLAAAGGDRPATVKVATYNQYFGADLLPLAAATSAEAFNTALLDVLRQAAANRFAARARQQAALLERTAPDLIALQEVWRYQCQDLPPEPGACADPSIRGAFVDQLDLTLAALNRHRPRYRLAARVANLDTSAVAVTLPGGTVHGLPFAIGGRNGLLRTLDRDVILARQGVDTAPLTFTGCRVSADGCAYRTVLQQPLPPPFPGTIPIERGFVGVDALVRGQHYRLVATHLEVAQPDPANPQSMFFQSSQAAELLAHIAAPPADGRRLILAGDLNSAPGDVPPAPGIVPPYRRLAAAGYLDAWASARGPAAGFTCCQEADLRNARSQLSQRIDLILTPTGPWLVRDLARLGENPADRTRTLPYRLWPSDHAGLAARLQF